MMNRERNNGDKNRKRDVNKKKRRDDNTITAITIITHTIRIAIAVVTCPFDSAVHRLMELLMNANIELAELNRLPCASTSLLLAVSSS